MFTPASKLSPSRHRFMVSLLKAEKVVNPPSGAEKESDFEVKTDAESQEIVRF